MTDNKTFEEIFEELARHNDRSVIWNDFLDYAIEVNLLTLARDKSKNEFKRNYHGNEEAYMNMIEAWINELNIKLETMPYYDILGEFYEELVQSRSKSKSLGQVYTPPSVTNLLSEISYDSMVNGKIASDPACGSARTLLSIHVKSQGKLFSVGQDLDETSCKMAVLNFFSHGVRGSILHMDTLEETFYKGWRVNRYLYHGVPVPHIELIDNPNAAYDFIELNRLNNNPGDVSLIDNDNNNDDEAIADSTIKPVQVQSTLI